MSYHRPMAPQGRPESIISDVSEEDNPDTAHQQRTRSGRNFVPSISSDQSHNYYRPAPESPANDGTYNDSNNNNKYMSPSHAPAASDGSLSDAADAYRNQVAMSGNNAGRGTTPTPYEIAGGMPVGSTVEELQAEVIRLRRMVEHETVKREEMNSQFKKWKEIMTHNTRAHIQNSKVNLHKNYMRIHPLLNDDGDYPDMVVFPTTVGILMKMNEAHLTRLVVFYGLQTDAMMDYYAKYCALRDHLGIEP